MGRSKPRTNKRPPPKPRQPRAVSPASTPSGTPPPPPSGSGLTPAHFDAALSLLPPHLPNLDAGDPSYQAALRSWSSATWNQLQHFGHLPYLSPAYVSALAGVACGFADGFLSADGASLPHSLPALLEARVALDSEKAKLIRMQGELKEYREAQKAGSVGGNARAGPPPPPLNAKGKEVAVDDDDDLAECTCGRNGHTHEYPGSAHSASDDYYYYDTEDEDGCCECCSHDHSYVECDHDGECDCEEYDSHSHTHSHGHSHSHHDHHHHQHEHDHGHDHHGHEHRHEGEVDSDPGLEYDSSPRERGAFEAVVVGPDGRPANLTPEQALALFGDPASVALHDLPPPGYLNSPEARAILARHHAKSHEVAAAKRQLAMLSMEDRVSEAAAQDTEVREARSRAEVLAHARETAILLSQSERQRIMLKEFERRQAFAAEAVKAEAPRFIPPPTAPARPAAAAGDQPQQQQQTQQPRKRLADDPERMDEQCRKLFNWVKAVVWSIEQGAIFHARKEAALAYERKHSRMPPCPPQQRRR